MFRKLSILYIKYNHKTSVAGMADSPLASTEKYKVTLRFKAPTMIEFLWWPYLLLSYLQEPTLCLPFLLRPTAERNSAWDTFFAFFTWNLVIFSSSIFCFVIFPVLFRPIAVWPVFNFPANFDASSCVHVVNSIG